MEILHQGPIPHDSMVVQCSKKAILNPSGCESTLLISAEDIKVVDMLGVAMDRQEFSFECPVCHEINYLLSKDIPHHIFRKLRFPKRPFEE